MNLWTPDSTALRTVDAGGPATLRTATRDDIALIARLLLQLGERSRFLRFHVPWRMSDQAARREAERMLASEGGRVALLVLVTRDGEQEAVAVGELAPVGERTAELALVVRDDLQRRGIGGWLGRALVARAYASGVRRLRAEVLAENHPARRLLGCLGFDRQLAAVYGTVTLQAELGMER